LSADGDGDAYGFLDISKDREVEIKEVEEPVKRVVVYKTKRGEVPSSSAEVGQMSAEIFGLQRCKYLVALITLSILTRLMLGIYSSQGLSGCPEGKPLGAAAFKPDPSSH